MSERLDTTLAEAPARAAGLAATLPRTALLYTDEALLTHVEQTLAALRVPVVYRAALAQADRSALAGANPEIALINLDDRCGEELDALTATLDAAGVPIVFNDADISHGLEGWARARWARHLVAKLCGKDDVDPPRPREASPPPQADAIPAAAAATSVVDAIAPQVAELAEPVALAEPALHAESASLPLSKGEIDSLLADFPTDATVGGADTEALSAHVDALLANAADSASHEPAPWDVTFVEAEPGHASPESAKTETSGSPFAEALAKSAPPSADQWQLVEDFTPVAPAAKPATPAPSTSFGSGLALELEPLEPTENGQ